MQQTLCIITSNTRLLSPVINSRCDAWLTEVCYPRKHLFLKPLLFYSVQEGKAASQFAPQHRGALSLLPWQCLLCPHLPLSCLPVQTFPSISIQRCRTPFPPDLPFVSPRYMSARFPPTPAPALSSIQGVIKFYDISCLPTLCPSVCQLVPVFKKLLYSNPHCSTFSWYEI